MSKGVQKCNRDAITIKRDAITIKRDAITMGRDAITMLRMSYPQVYFGDKMVSKRDAITLLGI